MIACPPDGALLPQPDEVHTVLRNLAAAVAVVTVRSGDKVHGMTVTSLTSVSLAPPLVLVCLQTRTRTGQAVRMERPFVVSMLREDQAEVARAFSTGTDEARAAFVSHSERTPGIPAALACLSCVVVDVVDGGDHMIVVGRVSSCSRGSGGPLVRFGGAYVSVEHSAENERGHA